MLPQIMGLVSCLLQPCFGYSVANDGRRLQIRTAAEIEDEFNRILGLSLGLSLGLGIPLCCCCCWIAVYLHKRSGGGPLLPGLLPTGNTPAAQQQPVLGIPAQPQPQVATAVAVPLAVPMQQALPMQQSC